MDPKVSIIVPSFQKSQVLKWGLFSLAKQHIPSIYEVLVLNDGVPDETEAICKRFEQNLNIRYVFTGQRNLEGEMKFRGPGFAINIGAKLANGEIMIICNPEMFHLNDTIAQLVNGLLHDRKLIAIPMGVKDQDGTFLDYLEKHNGDYDMNSFYIEYVPIKTYLPYLISLYRDAFLSIGGFDEDFVGIAYEDSDLIYRLLDNGHSFFHTQAKTIHLFHSAVYGADFQKKIEINYALFRKKRGQIFRNLNREWGII